ncbi:MAG: ParB/RepB/Spo0J family partition protein [Ruminobacter sp.]|nr:ParB/RepB/Spo0J family partition protein [Ruminobacter sp.]
MSQFLELDINLIDEDPDQPRTEENSGFRKESLEELAQTIKSRGVKSPISVRKTENGRYIINHGARRFRASKLAGKATIPAFIDSDYTKLDQVIENIQRENLSPREIANYIGYRISAGIKKTQIAIELGKSNAWVSQFSTLLNLPECLDIAVNTNKIQDVTAINDLSKLYKTNPEEVANFVNENAQIGRNDVNALKQYILNLNSGLEVDFENSEESESDIENIKKNLAKQEEKKHERNQSIMPKILVQFNNDICELKLVKPQTQCHAVIVYQNQELEVSISDLILKEIV